MSLFPRHNYRFGNGVFYLDGLIVGNEAHDIKANTGCLEDHFRGRCLDSWEEIEHFEDESSCGDADDGWQNPAVELIFDSTY